MPAACPTYFVQHEPLSIRRYVGEHGERWLADQDAWTADCASRRACIMTHDEQLSAEDFKLRYPKIPT